MVEATTQLRNKPKFSMDMMIFGNINEINKNIDTNAIEVESGNMENMPDWRAGLYQLYRNIENFVEEEEKKLYIDAGFETLDRLVDPINRDIPTTATGLRQVLNLLRGLNSVIYEERNIIFLKIRKQMAEIDKLIDSEFPFLPKMEKEKLKKELEDASDNKHPK